MRLKRGICCCVVILLLMSSGTAIMAETKMDSTELQQEQIDGIGENFAAMAEAAVIAINRVYETALRLHGQDTASQAQEKTASITINLLQDEEYFYDLDEDGVKEKIRYVVTEHEDNQEIILFVNDEEKYRERIDYALYTSYTISDIDETDGYLDLFLLVTSDSFCLEYAAFQQYQSNQIITLTSNLASRDLQFIRGYEIEDVDGKGNFTAVIDTPFAIEAIGCYYSYVPFIMENGEVKQKKVNTYRLADNSKDFKYILEQDIKVYSNDSLTSKELRTIKKGEGITISQIKPEAGSDVFEQSVPINVYAYIEDENGEKGWIYIDKMKYDWANPLFKETPAWG